MNDKVRPEHLDREAIVYGRQSSLGQLRDHQESARRQAALQGRARQLGWDEARIVLLQESTAKSGSTTHGRDAFHELSRMVVERKAGIILALDVSRWARDSVAWQVLLRDCIFSGVLLADETRVYDPADLHDHVYLGLQGVLAEHELKQLRERTLQCWWNKARRGELFTAIPTGYVEVRGKGLEKHPNQRVQNSINRMFQKFREMPSVFQLWRWYLQRDERLPFVPHGGDPHDVQWLPADYKRLLWMLKNPAYTGAYVLGKTKTILERQPDGELVRRRRPLPPDQWQVVERQRFTPYIDWQQYQQNLAKIRSNAIMQGDASPSRPGRGASLLSGLLRCARCGHRLQVRYDRSGLPRYVCRGGRRQRQQGTLCLTFSGRRIEPLFSQMVLEAVRPAAVEAAYAAAQRRRDDVAGDRQMRLDHLKQLQYEAERARRQYDRVEPEHRLVVAQLEARWNEALVQLDEAQRQFAAFEQQAAQHVVEAQLSQLLELGQQLERVWDAPHTDAALRQQIARTLVEEVVVDLDELRDAVQMWIHWSGGHHTQLSAPRAGRRGRSAQAEAVAVIRLLRAVCDDAGMAQALNRNGVPCRREKGSGAWNAAGVRSIRQRHGIAPFDPQEKSQQGWLSQQEAAREMGISPMSVHRLIERGLLPAEQAGPGLPSIIRRADLQLPTVQEAVYHIKSKLPRPLPADPNQLPLF